MSLLFMDGFDHYASADVLKKWTTAPTNSGGTVAIAPTGGRRGGGCLQLNNGNMGWAQVTKDLVSPVTTIIEGFAFKPSALVAASLLRLLDTSGTHWPVGLGMDATGNLIATGNDDAVTLGKTSQPVLTAGNWAYVEIMATMGAGSGAVEVKVNDISVIKATGLSNVYNSGYTQFAHAVLMMSGTSSAIGNFDDLYICDTGGTTNNGFLGDCRIDVLRPNTAGTYQEWPTGSQVMMAPHAYWRITPTKLQGAYAAPAISELAFHSSAGGAQIATGGSAVSSGDKASYPASNAFDANTNTEWVASTAADGSGNISTAWLGYHFASPVMLAEIAITGASDSGSYDSTAFNLDFSDDGVNWTTLQSFTTTANWGLSEKRTFAITNGAAWPLVNDATPDTTSYVSSNTPGQRETFKVNALPVGVNPIAVQTAVAAMKDDTQSRSIIPMVRTNGADVTGTDTQLTANAEAYYTMPMDQSGSKGHRYWRFYFIDNNGGNNLFYGQEHYLASSPGGANLLTQAPVPTVSASSNGGGILSELNDGIVSGQPGPFTSAGVVTNQWVLWSFNAPVTVAEFGLTEGVNSGNATTDGADAPKDLKLQYSDDGVNFTDYYQPPAQTGWGANGTYETRKWDVSGIVAPQTWTPALVNAIEIGAEVGAQ